jgi:hypothetical protein
LENALELAGHFAAHAVWCVSDGDVLIPIGARHGPGDERQMNRFVTDPVEEGVAHGKEWLDAGADGSDVAVLVYDGYVTLPAGKTDSLLLDVRRFGQAPAQLLMAVPYRNAAHPAGFAVYRPKFLSQSGIENPDYGALGDAFFRGVDQHEQGAAVWNACLDESQ